MSDMIQINNTQLHLPYRAHIKSEEKKSWKRKNEKYLTCSTKQKEAKCAYANIRQGRL